MTAKENSYKLLLAQLESLLEGELDVIANLANASALLYDNQKDLNWAGFYLYKNDELVLGPFQGKPACMHIGIGKGVCGTSAQKRETIVVYNVHEFPGHIACDCASNSEIVIPLIKGDTLLGVLDIDSPIIGRFDEIDAKYLEKFCSILLQTL